MILKRSMMVLMSMEQVWNCCLKDGPMIWKEPTLGHLVETMSGSGDTIAPLAQQTVCQVGQKLFTPTMETIQVTWVGPIGQLHQS